MWGHSNLQQVRIKFSKSMDTSDNQRNEGESSGSRSNDDDKGKKPLTEEELQAATPGNPSGEDKWDSIKFHCEFFDANEKLGYGMPAVALWQVLRNLGMSSEVEEDELCNMLKLSGYADEAGALSFISFTLFSLDFKLLESLRTYNASFLKGELDRGALGRFFGALEAGAESGFMCYDFVAAFRELQMILTDEDADSLVRYADLPRDVSISFTFEQFLETLVTDDGKGEWITALFRRTLALDRDQPLGRMMAFVSSYTRSAMRKNLR